MTYVCFHLFIYYIFLLYLFIHLWIFLSFHLFIHQLLYNLHFLFIFTIVLFINWVQIKIKVQYSSSFNGNVRKWSQKLEKSPKKCRKIFKACLAFLGSYPSRFKIWYEWYDVLQWQDCYLFKAFANMSNFLEFSLGLFSDTIEFFIAYLTRKLLKFRIKYLLI